MSYITWKIERTPSLEDSGWDDGNEQEITNFKDIVLNTAIGDNRDSFQFNVKNFNDTYSNVFSSNDKITIYRVVNSDTATTDDILMVGTVKKVPSESDSKKNTLRVSGYNFSESVMSAIVFVDFSAGLTIPQAIQAAINNAGDTNPNFKVTWNSSNPTVKQDGSVFPTVYDKWFNKPLRSIIEKYSANAKTNDGDYFWYVNNNNEFIWRAKGNTSSGTFNDLVDNARIIKTDKNIDDVKNFFILKGGYGPNNKQIQTKSVDWSSVAKHGMKYKLIPSEVNTAKNLVGVDIIKSYGTDQSPDGYPSLATSFTTAWTSNFTYTTKQYNISVVPGSTVTINEGSEESNKKAYAELIKEEITQRLLQEGEDLKRLYALGKREIDLQFRAGEKDWQLGSLIDVTLKEYGTGVVKMRVKEIQYTTTTDLFSLEEDEGTL